MTKFQFSSVFRQAWSKGMSIDNICAGFKKAGVYPFDPEAILKNCSESMSTGDDEDFPEDESASSSPEDQFTPEQLKLFEERFQNDYDIYTDNDYVAWLQEFHPDSVPSIEAMLGLQCDDNSDSNPSTLTTSSPTSHSSSSPTAHTSGAPSTHTSGSPTAHTSRTHTNGSPLTHTSGSPSTHTNGSLLTHTSGSPTTHSSGSPSTHTSSSPTTHISSSPSTHTSSSPSTHTSGSSTVHSSSSPSTHTSHSKPTHSSENCSKTPSNSFSAPKSASKSQSVFKDILNLPNQTPAGRRKTKTVSGARQWRI